MEKKESKNLRYWIAPLLAGGCLGFGYGITQRILILQSNAKTMNIGMSQEKNRLPGKTINQLNLSQQIKLIEQRKFSKSPANPELSKATLKEVKQNLTRVKRNNSTKKLSKIKDEMQRITVETIKPKSTQVETAKILNPKNRINPSLPSHPISSKKYGIFSTESFQKIVEILKTN